MRILLVPALAALLILPASAAGSELKPPAGVR